MIGLREHKGASLRLAIPDLPEEYQKGIREIVGLQSSNPRKGHATTLMWDVVSEADRAGMVLMLMPEPFDAGMDKDKLTKWYQRFGFQEVQQQPVVLMARQAQPRRIVSH